MRIEKDYQLKYLNTFQLSARARYFVIVKDKKELLGALKWADANRQKISLFAGGSNLVMIGKKINGLVIKISGSDFTFNGNLVSAWAGTGLTKLAKISFGRGLTGLEWAYGVPGSIGGAVRGNAGAYGRDISLNVVEAEAYDRKNNKIIKFSGRACRFSYRHSIFKDRPDLIILKVKLKLAKGRTAVIEKAAADNFQHRFSTKPKDPSAGCIFKNLFYTDLLKANRTLALKLKALGLVRGGKIGVGYLIDQAGFKGKSLGGAEVSLMHANFIINAGGKAAAADIIKLIKHIKRGVKNKFKINLSEEVEYFGN